MTCSLEGNHMGTETYWLVETYLSPSHSLFRAHQDHWAKWWPQLVTSFQLSSFSSQFSLSVSHLLSFSVCVCACVRSCVHVYLSTYLFLFWFLSLFSLLPLSVCWWVHLNSPNSRCILCEYTIYLAEIQVQEVEFWHYYACIFKSYLHASFIFVYPFS